MTVFSDNSQIVRSLAQVFASIAFICTSVRIIGTSLRKNEPCLPSRSLQKSNSSVLPKQAFKISLSTYRCRLAETGKQISCVLACCELDSDVLPDVRLINFKGIVPFLP